MSLILMILAIVCLILEALEVQISRVHLGWLGLALWAIATVV